MFFIINCNKSDCVVFEAPCSVVSIRVVHYFLSCCVRCLVLAAGKENVENRNTLLPCRGGFIHHASFFPPYKGHHISPSCDWKKKSHWVALTILHALFKYPVRCKSFRQLWEKAVKSEIGFCDSRFLYVSPSFSSGLIQNRCSHL